MHGGSNLLVRFLAAACVTLAGCGGPGLLKAAQPLESSGPVAEEKDEHILASIEAVILRNGPGAWARDADWDEYRIRIRSLSNEPVEIREVAIFDALDHRIESRSDFGELVDGTRATQRRYMQSGELVIARGSNPWVTVGVILAGAGVLMRGAGTPGFGYGIDKAAAGVAIAGIGGAGVRRLMNDREVDSEIKRRATMLPVALPRDAQASLDLFFPVTPRSGRTQVVYADRHGEHRLDIDTRQALVDLERDPPPTIVSRRDPTFPDVARRQGIDRGYVVAILTLDERGRVEVVDVIESVPLGVFTQEARRTLQGWTYTESRHESRTVEVRLEFRR
jgi:hypothetical protein